MKKGMRKDVEEFLRQKLEKELAKCPPRSIAMFNRIFQNKKIPSGKLVDALELIERSLRSGGAADGYMWKEWMQGILQ